MIPFPGVKCLGLTEGKLYVGTARSLYRFAPISVDEQVEVRKNKIRGNLLIYYLMLL